MSGPGRRGAGPDHAPLTRMEIAFAVPHGSRRARSQGEVLAAAHALPELQLATRVHQHNLMEWLRIHVRYASWEDRTSRPTRALVCEQAGFSVSTYKACRAWWQARGVVGVVRPGWTPHLRAGSLAGADDPNSAAVYVLCIPYRKRPIRPAFPQCPVTRPLPLSRRDAFNPVRARTAQSDPESPGQGRIGRRFAPAHFRCQVAVMRKGPGQKLSDRHVAVIIRPFLAAGWSPADLEHALAYERGGRRHPGRVDTVRDAEGWLTWRLSSWLRPDKTPHPSPSAERAAWHERIRAEQAARRQADAAAAAAAVPAPEWVGELIAELRRKAARSWRRRAG